MRYIIIIILLVSHWGHSHELSYAVYKSRQWHINNQTVWASFVKSNTTHVVLELQEGQFKSYPIQCLSLSDQMHVARQKSKIQAINNNNVISVAYNLQQTRSNLVFTALGVLLCVIILYVLYNYIYKFKTNTRFYILGIVCLLGLGFKNAFQNKIINTNSALKIDSAFTAFKPYVQTFWNNSYFYVESTGIPHSHAMMYGISNHGWQQQVPLPQCYKGSNAWPIPLSPVISNSPIPVDSIHFTRGAIAIAVNGVPIFNVHTNTGVDSYLDGQLDQFGGHCGRADDYHYHIAPLHLYAITSASLPIAYALDGFAVYGSTEPDGSPMLSLDANHGHFDGNGGYHYHGTQNAPYMIAKMAGQVTEDATHQLIPQAAASPVRTENWTPLNGALITSCIPNQNANGYSVNYQLNGISGFATTYSWSVNGVYSFTYTSPGSTVIKTYNGFIPCSIGNLITNPTLHNAFELYPNPSSSMLYIKTHFNLDVPYTICIRNAEGKTVYYNTHGVSPISVSDLKKGMYSIEIHNLQYRYSKLFFKD